MHRFAAAPCEEMAPRVTRETAGVLSEPVFRVAHVGSNSSEMRETWASIPACSRSLLVMSPVGLSADTKRFWMLSGKGHRQTYPCPVWS